MIDKEKIEHAAHFATDTSDLIEVSRGMFAFSQETIGNAFKKGINWYLDNLWHDASENPEEDMPIVVEFKRNYGRTKRTSYDLYETNHFYCEWDKFVKVANAVRWLYIDDLLKGGAKLK